MKKTSGKSMLCKMRSGSTRKDTARLKFLIGNEASLKKVQAALQQLGTTLSDTRHMFGANEKEVDPVRHLNRKCHAVGRRSEKDTLYLPITPAATTAIPFTD